MKFPYLFKSSETTAATSAWPWPTCVNSPKTLSFRANPTATNIYKTLNSAFLDDDEISSETPDSFFSIRREESFSSDESAVVLGLRSDRLFFEPGETNSILEEAKSYGDFPYKQSAALMAMDSRDPFLDFRVSMEEMVEAHGLKDWGCLEELLTCYLRVNRKSNHGFIVGAFVDLLLRLALAADDNCASTIDEQCSSSSTATQLSFTSPLSFSSSTYSSISISPCLSLLENGDGIIVDKNVNAPSSSSSSCSLGV
ncbi:transcription repressor ofp13 [Phtheirospermum japonicum]|uniref:Transcription repressor n=1 Tax=Phtheirospermum japonicum TaxID=374723 RepID=A0A830BYC7_9LAMI|nr:transcription repressor ofp13 [Phtheirospermum japonicum]